eukprot:scaffold1646_cov384-Prasinococcus_capsulatus_cf.AAC.3
MVSSMRRPAARTLPRVSRAAAAGPARYPTQKVCRGPSFSWSAPAPRGWLPPASTAPRAAPSTSLPHTETAAAATPARTCARRRAVTCAASSSTAQSGFGYPSGRGGPFGTLALRNLRRGCGAPRKRLLKLMKSRRDCCVQAVAEARH